MRFINWQELFVPTVSLLELVVRGSLMYLVLFTLLRLVLKRVAATLSLGDLLMIVLLADAAQNAMTADYKSVTDGVVLVGTIIFWSYTLDWLGHRFASFGRFVHPPPLPLVRDGQMLLRNMRRELITVEELMSHLREHGIKDLGEVLSAHMEGDGRISVVRRDGEAPRPPEPWVK